MNRDGIMYDEMLWLPREANDETILVGRCAVLAIYLQ
jgi:hypothetical protein